MTSRSRLSRGPASVRAWSPTAATVGRGHVQGVGDGAAVRDCGVDCAGKKGASGTRTVTSALHGQLRHDAASRAEFFTLIAAHEGPRDARVAQSRGTLVTSSSANTVDIVVHESSGPRRCRWQSVRRAVETRSVFSPDGKSPTTVGWPSVKAVALAMSSTAIGGAMTKLCGPPMV